MAEPREIRALASTRELVDGTGFTFEDRERHELKGSSVSVTCTGLPTHEQFGKPGAANYEEGCRNGQLLHRSVLEWGDSA